MRPVSPRLEGLAEVDVAESQHEYLQLVAAPVEYADGSRALITRWTFSSEERKAIARGEDLYLAILTFGRPLQPVSPTVGPPEGLTQEPA